MNDLLSAAITDWFAAYVARRGEGPSPFVSQHRRLERQHYGETPTSRRLPSGPARMAAETTDAENGRILTGPRDMAPAHSP